MQVFRFVYALLLDRSFLYLLLVVNLLGTAYGFVWYAEQLEFTWAEISGWLVWFVPDSPTASLFFCFSLIYLIRQGNVQQSHQKSGMLRQFVEAFAVVTSVKYGIWCVWMIVMAAQQQDPIVWQEWMLITSHAAMAIQGVLYARFFTYRYAALLLVGLWTIGNDLIDYGLGVYPSLSRVLKDDLGSIQMITHLLSLFSLGVAFALRMKRF